MTQWEARKLRTVHIDGLPQNTTLQDGIWRDGFLAFTCSIVEPFYRFGLQSYNKMTSNSNMKLNVDNHWILCSTPAQPAVTQLKNLAPSLSTYNNWNVSIFYMYTCRSIGSSTWSPFLHHNFFPSGSVPNSRISNALASSLVMWSSFLAAILPLEGSGHGKDIIRLPLGCDWTEMNKAGGHCWIAIKVWQCY